MNQQFTETEVQKLLKHTHIFFKNAETHLY